MKANRCISSLCYSLITFTHFLTASIKLTCSPVLTSVHSTSAYLSSLMLSLSTHRLHFSFHSLCLTVSHSLSRMKSLEQDALKAQMVIAKSKEGKKRGTLDQLSESPSPAPTPSPTPMEGDDLIYLVSKTMPEYTLLCVTGSFLRVSCVKFISCCFLNRYQSTGGDFTRQTGMRQLVFLSFFI